MSNLTGTIFAIKRYAIHDGPNIRTTIFFKGCDLACWWCHNPEGISKEIQIVSNPSQCIDCGQCLEDCPHGVLANQDGIITRDETRCEKCCTCVHTCPALAHETTGWTSSVNQVLEEILKDQAFYTESGGGVTFSGGDPLQQPDFLLALLQACGAANIHRTVDTAAYASREIILAVAKHTDLFLLDLKHMNNTIHKQHTGVGNRRILDNIETLSERGSSMRIRIPLIPGVNNDETNLTASAQFVKSLGSKIPVDILPYHNTALSKYNKLGLDYPYPQTDSLSDEAISSALQVFNAYGISPQLGG